MPPWNDLLFSFVVISLLHWVNWKFLCPFGSHVQSGNNVKFNTKKKKRSRRFGYIYRIEYWIVDTDKKSKMQWNFWWEGKEILDQRSLKESLTLVSWQWRRMEFISGSISGSCRNHMACSKRKACFKCEPCYLLPWNWRESALKTFQWTQVARLDGTLVFGLSLTWEINLTFYSWLLFAKVWKSFVGIWTPKHPIWLMAMPLVVGCPIFNYIFRCSGHALKVIVALLTGTIVHLTSKL